MTAPSTTPGRHPAGRTFGGSGANRGSGFAALIAVFLLGAACAVFVAARFIDFTASHLAGVL